MKINITPESIKAALAERAPRAPRAPRAKLPGEKHPFREMRSERNLTPPQTLASFGAVASSRHTEVRREPSIDEKFQAFLAGEARQRKALQRQLLAEQYRTRFLTNVLAA